MASVVLEDSRRLTGPNLVSDRPGAVIDGVLDGVDPDAFRRAWEGRAAEILSAVGWVDQVTASRSFEGGITVFHSAPVDALYAATEVNEWAWQAAAADFGAGEPPALLAEASERLRHLIAKESNGRLLALQAAARDRGRTFLSDDDYASVGTGTGCSTWPVGDLPDPADVSWDRVHDIPRVLVTGTNGKTTTVRMLDAIGRQARRHTGFTCTDGVHVGGELLEGGDWSGPGGARAVLRHPEVELAILETARGGMLRRGLAVDRADGALVTNVAADHLGEWGILTVEDVALAKLTVARAVRHGAPLVVNADDPVLSRAAFAIGRPLVWVTVEEATTVRASLRDGDTAWLAEDGWIVRTDGRVDTALVEVSAIPATIGGAALYNVANALGAAALAHAMGLRDDVIAAGLTGFAPSPEDSPGRTNLFEVGGVRVMVDFVHNPHGLAAVGKLVDALGAERTGIMIGHAGDRDDRALQDLAQAVRRMHPARVAVKEVAGYLRGRALGEVPVIIRDELLRLGQAPEGVTMHPDEIDAALALFEWAGPGDLLLLSTQADRSGVLALVRRLQSEGWTPGSSPRSGHRSR